MGSWYDCWAFKSIIHDHEFAEDPAGTLMTDRFEFKSPFAILGRIVDQVFLTSYMRRFIVHRNEVLKQLAESTKWSSYLEHS